MDHVLTASSPWGPQVQGSWPPSASAVPIQQSSCTNRDAAATGQLRAGKRHSSRPQHHVLASRMILLPLPLCVAGLPHCCTAQLCEQRVIRKISRCSSHMAASATRGVSISQRTDRATLVWYTMQDNRSPHSLTYLTDTDTLALSLILEHHPCKLISWAQLLLPATTSTRTSFPPLPMVCKLAALAPECPARPATCSGKLLQ